VRRLSGTLSLTLAGLVWGSLFVVSRGAFVPPLVVAWAQYLVAALLIGLVLLLRGSRPRLTWRDGGIMALMALGGYIVSAVAQFTGTKLGGAAVASVVGASTPAFVVLWARPLLGEAFTWQKLLAVVSAGAGVCLMVGIGRTTPEERLAVAVLALGAVGWALMSVLLKAGSERTPPLVLIVGAMTLAVLAMTPLAVTDLRHLPHPLWTEGGVLLRLLYLGVVSTAGGYTLWTIGLRSVEAGVAGLFLTLQPVVGTLLGWLLLGETVGLSTVVGGALIVAAIVVGVWGEARPHPRGVAA
jgi:drug/metabolite transporter (DMT)-like permease